MYTPPGPAARISRRLSRASTLLLALLVLGGSLRGEEPDLGWRVSRDARGRGSYHGVPVDASVDVPWPKTEELSFQRRADEIIRAQSAQPVRGVNTYFENEKRSYGWLMAQALGGHAEKALAHLQAEDHQREEWHRETAGIDFYAAFTLKHQVRKYFYFGELLDPAYRKRMFDGAKRWTEKDPLRRPHHAFREDGPGWGPDVKNSWVDVRSTENLWLMRVAAVYLFAEETGNEETRQTYREQILRYAASLYRVGMGEWDSENYHGHSLAPLVSLFDFAKDPAVKLAARVSLDWLFVAGAVKYWRGGFNGPTKRDYNHTQPFGGSAASMLWVAFGDAAVPNIHWESDEVHLITSRYRPPLAALALARKQFARPTGLLASKPVYHASTSGDWSAPAEHLETQWFGTSYQMGSLAGGTSAGAGDVNGFKILAARAIEGVGTIQCVPGADPLRVGSPQYEEGKVSAPNRVAQHRNVAIWLVENGESPWTWVLPDTFAASVSPRTGTLFVETAGAIAAFQPIALEIRGLDAELTRSVRTRNRKDHWPDHQVISARGTGGKLSGFVVEVGDLAGIRAAQFREGIEDRSRIDLEDLGTGRVRYRSLDGHTLEVTYARELDAFRVVKDGVRHDWARHAAFVYQAHDEATPALVHQERGSGRLLVRVGAHSYQAEVDERGHARFTSR